MGGRPNFSVENVKEHKVGTGLVPRLSTPFPLTYPEHPYLTLQLYV